MFCPFFFLHQRRLQTPTLTREWVVVTLCLFITCLIACIVCGWFSFAAAQTFIGLEVGEYLKNTDGALYVTKTWVWHDSDALDECENVRAEAVCLDWVWSKHDVLVFFFLAKASEQCVGNKLSIWTDSMSVYSLSQKKNMAKKMDNGWDARSKRVWIQVGTFCVDIWCSLPPVAGRPPAGVWGDKGLLHHKVN